jgi:hypothetical protein
MGSIVSENQFTDATHVRWVYRRRFNTIDCDFDFTRFLRFPCDHSTCDIDMTEVTLGCGGLTSQEYALAQDMETSRLSITYICVPNGQNLGRLGELISMPFNAGGDPTRLVGGNWPTGVRRPQLDFNPSYSTTLTWYVMYHPKKGPF